MENSDNDSGEEEGGLTQEQVEQLAQLQDLTGIEDTAICRALLESQNWDLELTAREHFGIQSEPNNENDPSPQRTNQAEQPQEPPIPAREPETALWRRPAGLFNLLLFVISFPLKIVTVSLDGALNFVSSLFGYPPRRSNVVVNPVGDVRAFTADFDAQYGSAHSPFFMGSYAQALEEAKKELKFLLVYLHCDKHQDTHRFCRDTLCNSMFVDYVNENLIMWGCSVESPEGFRVSEALRESTYPFLAVIVLRQNRMVVVGRQEGILDAETLVNLLQKTVRDNEAFIVAARADRDERNFNREIRNEQEAAFAETLRQDQEREEQLLAEEQQRREEEELRQQEEEAERLKIMEEADRKDRIQRMKIDLVSEIPEEPGKECPDCIRILIKLPGGQRLERRFLPTHSLKHLYYFVFCHPDSPDEFDIMTNYPRRKLSCQPAAGAEPPTLSEAGFGKSEMLFVNDLEA